MNNYIKDKIIEISTSLFYKVNGRQKHFAFIVRRNKIMSIGYNDTHKTHPLCFRYGYIRPYIHAEISALLDLQKSNYDEYHKSIFITLRLGKNYCLRYAKPCKYCSTVLQLFPFKSVYYSDGKDFVRMEF